MENLEALLSTIDKKLSEFSSKATVIEPKENGEQKDGVELFDGLIKITTVCYKAIKDETNNNPNGPVAKIPFWKWVEIILAFFKFLDEVKRILKD